METVLGKECLIFAETVAERSEDNKHTDLCDRLIRSTGGMAYHCLEAGEVGYGAEKADELYTALKFARESRVLFGLCVKNGVFDEAFSNRGARRIASLCYRITKAYDGAKDESARHPYRFPPKKEMFHTKRLMVRSWRKTDIAPFTELCSDADYKECHYYCETDPDKAYRKIKEDSDILVISRNGEDSFIGCLAVSGDGEGKGRFKLHVALNRDNRGRGYFSELIEGASRYALKKLGARAVAVYLPSGRNYLSGSLKDNGFEKEGVLRSYGADGTDVTVYSLVSNE